MEKYMAKQIVVETGKDFSNRTMIAVYGCYFPDPEHADYDLLLKDCLERLEPYSEKDYIIIFFAAPMEHQPKLCWIYDAYKRLTRKYKKNIKKLLVLHPSKWFKILIWVMSHILSHKFAKKVELVESLEDLENMVPIEKIFIPPLISGHDRGLSPVPEGANEEIVPSVKIFGAEVERAVPTGEVPGQIIKVVTALEESGLKDEGLFRLTPDALQVEQIRMSMDRDYDIDLSQFSPHALASALKAYFRQIPTPLIPQETYEKFTGVFDLNDDDDRIKYIKREILGRMSTQRRLMLGIVMNLLRKTSQNSEINKMRPKTLAVVWAPNLIRPETLEEEMRLLPLSQKFLEILIVFSGEIFPEQ